MISNTKRFTYICHLFLSILTIVSFNIELFNLLNIKLTNTARIKNKKVSLLSNYIQLPRIKNVYTYVKTN